MGSFSDYLSRRLWFGMLWVMRRSWMRRFQRRVLSLAPASRKEAAWQSYRRQERFARRYGLTMLRWVVSFLLISIVLTFMFHAALLAVDRGFLAGPHGLNAGEPSEPPVVGATAWDRKQGDLAQSN